jgi:hypothetical protein
MVEINSHTRGLLAKLRRTKAGANQSQALTISVIATFP